MSKSALFHNIWLGHSICIIFLWCQCVATYWGYTVCFTALYYLFGVEWSLKAFSITMGTSYSFRFPFVPHFLRLLAGIGGMYHHFLLPYKRPLFFFGYCAYHHDGSYMCTKRSVKPLSATTQVATAVDKHWRPCAAPFHDNFTWYNSVEPFHNATPRCYWVTVFCGTFSWYFRCRISLCGALMCHF